MQTHDDDLALGRLRPPAAGHAPDEGRSAPGLAPDHAHLLHLQRAAGNASVSRALAAGEEERSPVLDVVGKGGGQPLDAATRSTMEGHLGHDFGDVRVHTDAAAASSARSVQASAYTVGNDVVLGADLDPSSTAGQRTLAHELTHVAQQRAGEVDGTPAAGGIKVSDPSDRFEQEAERTADRAMAAPAGAEAPGVGAAPATVQRQEAAPEEEPVEEEEPVQTLAVQRQGEEDEVPEEEAPA